MVDAFGVVATEAVEAALPIQLAQLPPFARQSPIVVKALRSTHVLVDVVVPSAFVRAEFG
jgi:hypothetical protein